ncbi:MAG: Chemotaxis response regulator protein-glutamate methylesterase [Syntrophorhabdus sp. PtaB.Bin047]|jgi:two-component system chemotaxis response regulator CheB|nr:MAG: Chemotaxis response regulator protein-glutamate methylesterase [Syntrophorhabdus sp. PtaB.Bin047]
MAEKIKVLIVDDSAVVRQVLEEVLQSDGALQVVGSARDPFVAADIMKRVVPDVITLDVEMPRMDGITFLHKIMTQRPIPVVMCSSLTERNSETAMKALEYGAVDIIEKPRMGVKQYLEESKVIICDTVKAAAEARLGRARKNNGFIKVEPKLTADAVIEKPNSRAMIQTTERVVVVGASTGGTEALKSFLEALPLDAPGMVIVQHMPEHFTAAFARRLDGICRVSVKEAANDDTVVRGRVLIAPGNKHTLLKRSGARYYVEVKDGPLVSRHRPSVDVLFRSAARYAGKNAVGVIMTGMGDDGAKGMLEMKEAGAYTVAQDEATCVVFGMPKEAVKLGAVNTVAPLGNIAGIVMRESG